MKIFVLSDTHIPKSADWLPKKLCDELQDADLILHAGDLTDIDVYNRLKKIAPVRAVHGNMDDSILCKTLPEKDIIDAGIYKIGLIHGYGPPFGLTERVAREFSGVDIIVFGHSHSPKNETKNGVLFFNPGSPTDKIFTRSNSYGVIELNGKIESRIVRL
ncbi:MAG: metallophosphoesterase family protein [Candidatus Omnitrophica bacterium]|nr:metallophosphoesterase family protein [Candidatus Omnitrophota bacterium]